MLAAIADRAGTFGLDADIVFGQDQRREIVIRPLPRTMAVMWPISSS
jgi:hypothetical protein